MEKLNEKCCMLLSNSSHFEKAEPKAITKPQSQSQPINGFTGKPVQEPWSVFEGVYWI